MIVIYSTIYFVIYSFVFFLNPLSFILLSEDDFMVLNFIITVVMSFVCISTSGRAFRSSSIKLAKATAIISVIASLYPLYYTFMAFLNGDGIPFIVLSLFPLVSIISYYIFKNHMNK